MAVYLIVLLLGLAVGSFLNVVVYRVLNGESPFKGRSKCPKCGRQILWYDNIPLVSFLWLKAKCRFCRKDIAWHYPVLELLTGLLFVWWYGAGRLFFKLTSGPYTLLQPAFWLTVGLVLVTLAVADWYWGVLPDLFTYGLAGLALVYRVVLTFAGIMQAADFWRLVAAGVGAVAFFWGLLALTRGRGMGGGDVKLALALGWLLGWPKIAIGLLAAFLTGALAGVILIGAGRKKLKQTIPFGPFMILGAVGSLVWGDKLWQYLVGVL